MANFKLVSNFSPEGDQPEAIKRLADGLKKGLNYQTLLGVTGSGKTFVAANLIERVQKPALIISPNKILAAQLYAEFKTFFLKTRLNILFPITITTSLKHTSLRPTHISRKTPRSMTI